MAELASEAPITTSPPQRRRAPSPALYALIGALSFLAYVALWLGGRSPWARYVDHGVAVSDSSGAPLHAALFVVGWTVMVTAMMLPTALPLFGAFGRIVRRRPERRRLLLSLGAGFVGVWAAFGYLLVWADRVVHLVVERFRVVADRPQLIAAALLAAAGLYQFSELKRRCLTRCRSPLSFITPRWSGDSAGGDALRIGVNYGVSCLGCCWALMVVVFGLGTANVAVMLAFGLLMTVEKNVPRARRLTPVLGAVLVVGGTAISLASLT